jgi:hypothetical protein
MRDVNAAVLSDYWACGCGFMMSMSFASLRLGASRGFFSLPPPSSLPTCCCPLITFRQSQISSHTSSHTLSALQICGKKRRTLHTILRP